MRGWTRGGGGAALQTRSGPERRSWEIGAGDLAATTRARREFRAYLAAVAPAACDVTAAELVFGELVANAVRHAAQSVNVEVHVDGEVRLLVRNDGGAPSFGPQPPRLEGEGGRGLYIVSRIAHDIRIRASSDEVVVSASLPRDANATPASGQKAAGKRR